MFGTEDSVQLNTRCLGQYIDGAASISIEASLVGDQPDTYLPVAAFRSTSKPCSSSTSIPVYTAPLRAIILRARRIGLVVTCNLLQPRASFSSTVEVQSGRNCGRQLSRRAIDIPFPRVHRVGQQNDVGLRGRIDPDRRPGKSGVAKAAHRKQLATIGGEGRVDVPAKAAQNRCVGGFSGAVIFSTVSGDQISPSPSISACANFARSSAVENKPAWPATPPIRRDVGSCTIPRNMCPFCVVFRGRNFRATPPEAKSACVPSSAAQRCVLRVAIERLALRLSTSSPSTMKLMSL